LAVDISPERVQQCWFTGRWGRLLLTMTVCAFAVLTFPRVTPVTGSRSSLDFSWITGLNEVVRRHLVFGQDVVYNYGPLAFVAWPLDMGANLPVALGFRLAIHGFFCLAVALAMAACRDWVFAGLFAAVIIASGVAQDLMSVLLLSVLVFLTYSAMERQPAAALPAALLLPVALLLKLTTGVACAAAAGAWILLHILSRERRRGFGVPLVLFATLAVLTFLILFRVYGGPLHALPGFAQGSLLLALGYSAQMALHGPSGDYQFFGLLLLLLLLGGAFAGFQYGAGSQAPDSKRQVGNLSGGWKAASTARQSRSGVPPGRAVLIVFSILALPLYLLFKGAFVRHDAWHIWSLCEMMSALGCLLLLIPGKTRRQRAPLGLVLASMLALGVYWHCHQPLSNDFRPLLPRGCRNLAALAQWQAERRAAHAAWRDFQAQQALSTDVRERIDGASVDAYPLATSLVLANNLNWSPRFVFQSENVYTPEIDAANARHYRSSERPRFVLYVAAAGPSGRPQAIDNQHPMAVDPLTWLELYRWYDPQEWIGQIGVLERRSFPRFETLVPLGGSSLPLGQRWELPDIPAENHLLLKARFQLTTAGVLWDKVFKVYPPTMVVQYKDGTTRPFRVVWRNIANGFLVSDLPVTASQTESFWRRGKGAPVEAIWFQADPACFKDTVELEWLELSAG
jgi:hypothetical protein